MQRVGVASTSRRAATPTEAYMDMSLALSVNLRHAQAKQWERRSFGGRRPAFMRYLSFYQEGERRVRQRKERNDAGPENCAALALMQGLNRAKC